MRYFSITVLKKDAAFGEQCRVYISCNEFPSIRRLYKKFTEYDFFGMGEVAKEDIEDLKQEIIHID